MFWIILVGIFFVLALAGTLFMIYVIIDSMRSNRTERKTREQGRPLLCVLMMANHSLYDPDGALELPGVVVFGFFEPSAQLAKKLRPIANRCHELYTTIILSSLSPECRQFSKLLKDHKYHPSRRNRVPSEVTGSDTLYVADLWISRERLPDNWQEHRVMPCAVTGTDQGDICLLSFEDPVAQRIYSAAGVTTSSSKLDSPLSRKAPKAATTQSSSMAALFVWFAVPAILSVLLLVGLIFLIRSRSSADPATDPIANATAESTKDPKRQTPPAPSPPNITKTPRAPSSPDNLSSTSDTPQKAESFGVNQPGSFRPEIVLPKRSETESSNTPEKSDSNSDELRIVVESNDRVTFGPIGCPVVIVGNEVWHIERKQIVQELEGECYQRGMSALSGDGQWFAAASKSNNQRDTSIIVWHTVTGKKSCEIPGDSEKFRDLIRFSRNKYLILGGRLSHELEVWDAESGKQLSSISNFSSRIDSEKIAFSPDGQYFTTIEDYRLVVVQTKRRKIAATMETPPITPDPDKTLSDLQRRMKSNRVLSSIKRIDFSPDGKELAAVCRGKTIRLFCWDDRGKLIFHNQIPQVEHAFFFEPRFDWLPDKSGWVICANVYSREAKRFVFSLRMPFGHDLLFFPLDGNRLLGFLPNEPKVLQVIEIPWKAIRDSLQLMEEEAPAILSPYEPVCIEWPFSGRHGNRATKQQISEAFVAWLRTNNLQVVSDASTIFRIYFSDDVSDLVPVFKRPSKRLIPGHDSGRSDQIPGSSLVIELATNDKVHWRDFIYSRAISGTRERESIAEEVTRKMDQLVVPYFVPKSTDHVILPMRIE